jgi:hypothetical protein
MRTPDPFEYIRNYYGVPAKKGQRVETEHNGKLKRGTISGAHGQYIKITFDGEKKPAGVFHPTDGIRYLTAADAQREAFDAMEAEQKAEFRDYVNRCEGAPVSTVRP